MYGNDYGWKLWLEISSIPMKLSQEHSSTLLHPGHFFVN